MAITKTRIMSEITTEIMQRRDLAMGHKIVWGAVFKASRDGNEITDEKIARILDIPMDAAVKYVNDLIRHGCLVGNRKNGRRTLNVR